MTNSTTPNRPRFKTRLLAYLTACLLKALHYSYRLKYIGFTELKDQPLLLAVLHGHQLVLPNLVSHLPFLLDPGLVVPSSRHRDGDLAAAVVAQFGIEVVKGSSSKGGSAALLGLLRAVADKKNVAITIDGPRGPIGVAKPGIAKLALSSSCKIVPIAVASSRSYTFKSWDKMLLPLPFAKVVVVAGPYYLVGGGGGEGRPSVAEVCVEVERRIKAAQGVAYVEVRL